MDSWQWLLKVRFYSAYSSSWLYIKSGHCEVTISPDIFRDLKLLHNMRYLTATLKHALYFAMISNWGNRGETIINLAHECVKWNIFGWPLNTYQLTLCRVLNFMICCFSWKELLLMSFLFLYVTFIIVIITIFYFVT